MAVEARRLDLSAESLSVTSVAVTLVKPLQKTGPRETIGETIDCTANEEWFRDVYAPVVFAYRIGNGGTYEQLVSRMKDSLQEVLVAFYPFAGRCVATSSSKGFERQVLCNDEGVPFIEAYADADLDQFVPTAGSSLGTFQTARVSELHSKSYEAFGMDGTQWKQEMSPDGLPCVLIQVTRFKCGGVVVATTFSHMLTDATSFFHFMMAWSDIALKGQTAIAPDFDRASAVFDRLVPPSESASKSSIQEAPQYFPKKVFEVRKSVVESMKRDVKVETEGKHYVGTHDCVLAHIWQSLLRVQTSNGISLGKVITIRNVIEGRSKFFDHPVSKYLCGNIITLVALTAPTKLGAPNIKNPTSSRALQIREQLVATHPQEYWVSTVLRMATADMEASARGEIACWDNTSYLKLPVYAVDFGFTKPFFVFPATSFKFTSNQLGRSVVYPPRPGHHESAATLHLEINPRVIDTICSDLNFMSMFLEN